MSTKSPHPATPQASRKKRNMTPQAQKPALSTPPSSPPRQLVGNQSDPNNNNENATTKKKKHPQRSGKKPRDATPTVTHNGYYNKNQFHGPSNGSRHTPSHDSLKSPQMKESAAYAGPTFHASPAPSSLPMPKFLKPAADAPAPPAETDSDSASADSPEQEMTPSKHRALHPPVEHEPKPTALDFMFQAARQAKENKAVSSPDAPRSLRSPQTEPAPRYNSNGMFANGAGKEASIGPSFAPSYQQRMAALRPSSAPRPPEDNDAERKAKTEELKDLLLNPRPQKPRSETPFFSIYGKDTRSSPNFNHVSPNVDRPSPGNFDPRASNVPPFATPSRASSGPPSSGHPMASKNPWGPPPAPNPFLYSSYNPPMASAVPPSMSPYHGRMLPSDGSSLGYHSNLYQRSSNPPAPWQGHLSPQPTYSTTSLQLPTHSPSPLPLPSQAMDTRQIENDLRRVLKIDASSTTA